MIDNTRTGAYIARLRQKAGMTQTQLAAMMNVTHQAVSKWENGSALPDMQTMLNLSALFGVTIEQMLVVPDEALMQTGQNESVLPAETQLDRAIERIEEEIAMAQEEKTMAELDAQIENNAAESVRYPEEETENKRSDTPKIAPQFGWHHIIVMAPFLGKEVLAGMVENAGDEIETEQLIALAPFLPKEKLGFLAKKLAEKGEFGALSSIAPFAARETLGEIVEMQLRSGDGECGMVESLAPFLGREEMGRIARLLAEKGNFAQIVSLAPFIPRDALGDAVILLKQNGDLTPDAIASLAAFLPRWALTELATGIKQERSGGKNSGESGYRFDFSGAKEAMAAAMGRFSAAHRSLGSVRKPFFGEEDEHRKTKNEIIESLMDDGHWDAVGRYFDRVDSEMRKVIMTRAAEDEEWDFVDEYLDHCNSETRKEVMRAACEAENWELVESHFDRCNSETRRRIMEEAAENENWDFVEAHMDEVSASARAQIVRKMAEEGEWERVAAHYDKLSSADRIELIEAACDEEEWDFVCEHGAKESEVTRLAIAIHALEMGDRDTMLHLARGMSGENIDRLAELAISEAEDYELAQQLSQETDR